MRVHAVPSQYCHNKIDRHYRSNFNFHIITYFSMCLYVALHAEHTSQFRHDAQSIPDMGQAFVPSDYRV